MCSQIRSTWDQLLILTLWLNDRLLISQSDANEVKGEELLKYKIKIEKAGGLLL